MKLKQTKEQKDRYNTSNRARITHIKETNPEILWANRVRGDMKKRAKRNFVPFQDFSTEEILRLVSDTCPILGISIIYGGDKQTDNSATIDRYVPALGYVHGNIAVISQRANRIKNNATLNELRAIRDWLWQLTAKCRLL